MKKVIFYSVFLSLIFFSACQKDDIQSKILFEETINQQYDAPLDVNIALVNSPKASNCHWREIPAGSIDVLQDVIESMCENGVIYLKAGMHIENTSILINKSIKILGEEGATLQVYSGPILFPQDPLNYLLTVDPGIHIQDASGTLIQNVDIITAGGNASTAVLIDNSPMSGVMQSSITDFQLGVVIVKSDKTSIMHNTFVTAFEEWYNEQILDAYGVLSVSGEKVKINQNDFTDAVMGVWVSDKKGKITNNNFHDSFIGMLLCLVPPYVLMPDGSIEGAPVPATNWKVTNNNAYDNFTIGYLVIDGAKDNKLTNNQASNNGTYDIELVGDSYRFGYLTPAGINTTVKVGSANGITIKDCGINSTIIGNASMVDTNADPCD